MGDELIITGQTRVGELLRAYPQLEAVLFKLSPTFRKLKNPVLRRTVAKVVSLQQAAKVAGIPAAELVQRLRMALGQDPAEPLGEGLPDEREEPTPRPEWVAKLTIAATIDADALLETDDHPLGIAQRMLRDLSEREGVCIRSTFRPTPLIEVFEKLGHATHITREEPDRFRTLVRGRRPVD